MKRRKTLLIITTAMSFFAAGSQLKAQQIELSPLIGYETGAIYHYSGGALRLIGGMNYGGSVDVGMGHGRYVELSYTRMNSQSRQ